VGDPEPSTARVRGGCGGERKFSGTVLTKRYNTFELHTRISWRMCFLQAPRRRSRSSSLLLQTLNLSVRERCWGGRGEECCKRRFSLSPWRAYSEAWARSSPWRPTSTPGDGFNVPTSCRVRVLGFCFLQARQRLHKTRQRDCPLKTRHLFSIIKSHSYEAEESKRTKMSSNEML
jgi:hypothetical protein